MWICIIILVCSLDTEIKDAFRAIMKENSTLPPRASRQTKSPGIYCNMVHVSQPITWPIFCFGWKRWVLCTRKPWNDKHLSGAVENFLGSSSCAPFGVQPHQNQLPICAYVWGEIKRHWCCVAIFAAFPILTSFPQTEHRLKFYWLVEWGREGNSVKCFGVACSHICHVKPDKGRVLSSAPFADFPGDRVVIFIVSQSPAGWGRLLHMDVQAGLWCQHPRV